MTLEDGGPPLGCSDVKCGLGGHVTLLAALQNGSFCKCKNLWELLGAFPQDRVQEQPSLRSVWGTAPHRVRGASPRVEHRSFDCLPPFSLLSRCAFRGGQSSSKKMIYFSSALPPFHQDTVGKLTGDGLQLAPARSGQLQGLTQGWERGPAWLNLLCCFSPDASSSYIHS